MTSVVQEKTSVCTTMIGRLASLILLSTLSLVQTSEVPDRISLTVVELGDNVSLTCTVFGNEAGLFYWYKLKFGHMVQTVATGTFSKITSQEPFTNSRFTVTTVNAQHVLNIRNVSKEDEATYLCQAGSAYTMAFINSTLLAVNDHENLQKSVHVKQSPETELVQPGDSVTLQCSLLFKTKGNTDQCPGERSVYWFRSGSGESHPGIIYTHSNEEEERSCVYSLSKTIQNSSDTGTYYCAVVTCGVILFGEGTKVETRQELCPFVIVLGTMLVGCVIVIAVLIIFRKQKPIWEHSKVEFKYI
ncbi:platelet-derived growth factor receptor beta-like isoform X2 [Etheostoma cragini]|uniref:platelet-derived growth factor receptor beta-like isoform X2 n=1 Tax=Etheostoma cragini TaxID=417921 RepID=UPI00155F3527|nr:platelet-derived growth factor receptor beta-like isoform X2 [Etheostoma cragini]